MKKEIINLDNSRKFYMENCGLLIECGRVMGMVE